jgi:hypothetical protein
MFWEIIMFVDKSQMQILMLFNKVEPIIDKQSIRNKRSNKNWGKNKIIIKKMRRDIKSIES